MQWLYTATDLDTHPQRVRTQRGEARSSVHDELGLTQTFGHNAAVTDPDSPADN